MTAWLTALAIDLAFGDPPNRWHPVAWIGTVIDALRRRAPAGARAQLAYGTGLVAAPAMCAAGAGWLAGRLPWPLNLIASLGLLKSSFALRSLLDAGESVRRPLAAGDAGEARRGLDALVSRPTGELDEARVASAAIESVAENLADSYVAPLLFYAAGGLPAALAYRAVNTADAMIGYRGRFEWLGKATARLDDVLSFIPARISALALIAAAPLVGLDGPGALRGALRDHRRTASPNAGWPMAAAAGALGVELEKVDHYHLGAGGRSPHAADIATASGLVLVAALIVTAGVALARPPFGRTR